MFNEAPVRRGTRAVLSRTGIPPEALGRFAWLAAVRDVPRGSRSSIDQDRVTKVWLLDGPARSRSVLPHRHHVTRSYGSGLMYEGRSAIAGAAKTMANRRPGPALVCLPQGGLSDDVAVRPKTAPAQDALKAFGLGLLLFYPLRRAYPPTEAQERART